MRELIKPEKKTRVFEKLNVNAFHENTYNGGYSRGGTYLNTMFYDRYSKADSVDFGDDILF